MFNTGHHHADGKPTNCFVMTLDWLKDLTQQGVPGSLTGLDLFVGIPAMDGAHMLHNTDYKRAPLEKDTLLLVQVPLMTSKAFKWHPGETSLTEGQISEGAAVVAVFTSGE